MIVLLLFMAIIVLSLYIFVGFTLGYMGFDLITSITITGLFSLLLFILISKFIKKFFFVLTKDKVIDLLKKIEDSEEKIEFSIRLEDGGVFPVSDANTTINRFESILKKTNKLPSNFILILKNPLVIYNSIMFLRDGKLVLIRIKPEK